MEIISKILAMRPGERLVYWDTREHEGMAWGAHIESELGYMYADAHPVQALIRDYLESGKAVTMQERVGGDRYGEFLYWIVRIK